MQISQIWINADFLWIKKKEKYNIKSSASDSIEEMLGVKKSQTITCMKVKKSQLQSSRSHIHCYC